MRRRSSSRSDGPSARTDELGPAFGRELARSRRFGRSVAVLATSVARGAAEQQLVGTLELHLRRYDIVGVVDGGRPDRVVAVVVAPDTDRAEATTVRARLDQVLLGADPSPSLGLAVAPEDGDDLEALVGLALDRFVTATGGTRA